MSAALQSGLLAWVHFGDLHVTGAEAPNYRDAVALIEEVDANMREGVAFAVLPGDNAEDGTPHQFGLVRAALDRLALRVHILPGDHDRASGSLQSFYDTLGGERLPVSIVREGYTCLFLDIVSAGAGGPDFRLGPGQHDWLERELDRAAAEHRRSIVFMHAYPADLAERSSEVTALFARHAVAVVDMGHTHYNELANDGRTIYAATRSTGQNEEGRPGFSVLAVDGGLVSWRFKPLGEPWPLALITAPADRRLQTDASPALGRRKPAGPGAGVECPRHPGRTLLARWRPVAAHAPRRGFAGLAARQRRAAGRSPHRRRNRGRVRPRRLRRDRDRRAGRGRADVAAPRQRRAFGRRLAGAAHSGYPARSQPKRAALVTGGPTRWPGTPQPLTIAKEPV